MYGVRRSTRRQVHDVAAWLLLALLWIPLIATELAGHVYSQRAANMPLQ